MSTNLCILRFFDKPQIHKDIHIWSVLFLLVVMMVMVLIMVVMVVVAVSDDGGDGVGSVDPDVLSEVVTTKEK